MREQAAIADLEDRYGNYAILSRVLREEVDVPLLEALKGSLAAEPFENEELAQSQRSLGAYFRNIDNLSEARSTLASDYCLTFIGYGVDPDSPEAESSMHAAYPYESIYTTGGKTLTSGLDEGAAALFRAQGFRPSKPRILADDHIACELEFMQFLVSREIAAVGGESEESVDEVRAVERTFIDDHLLKFAALLSDAIDARSETDFYKSIGHMVLGWIQEDRRYLG